MAAYRKVGSTTSSLEKREAERLERRRTVDSKHAERLSKMVELNETYYKPKKKGRPPNLV